MNTSSGLNSSSNRNAMQLDAATRDGILARNQARVLSSIGVIKSDGFESGGLNPLKGLYSAAAAAFLKNKQGNTVQTLAKGKGGYERAADVMAKLASAKPQSASSADGPRTTTTTGPAKVNYSKYSWTGNGVTGSDSTSEGAPVGDEPAPEASIDDVINAIKQSVEGEEGTFQDNSDGTFDIKVLDISGRFSRGADSITGTIDGASGSYTFELRKDGQFTINTSSGDENAADFAQVKALLAGDLSSAPRVGPSDPEPEPATPADTTLDEYAGVSATMSSERTGDLISRIDAYLTKAGKGEVSFDQDRLTKALTVLSDYGSSSQVRAAADALAEESEGGEIGVANAAQITDSLRAAYLSGGGSGGAISGANYSSVNQLSRTFQDELKAAGGSVGSKNADGSINITFKGLSGKLSMTKNGIEGRLTGVLTSFNFSTDMSGHSATNTGGVTLLTQGAINDFKKVLGSIDRSNAGSVSAVA